MKKYPNAEFLPQQFKVFWPSSTTILVLAHGKKAVLIQPIKCISSGLVGAFFYGDGETQGAASGNVWRREDLQAPISEC
jgi:hypothetical protein